MVSIDDSGEVTAIYPEAGTSLSAEQEHYKSSIADHHTVARIIQKTLLSEG